MVHLAVKGLGHERVRGMVGTHRFTVMPSIGMLIMTSLKKSYAYPSQPAYSTSPSKIRTPPPHPPGHPVWKRFLLPRRGRCQTLNPNPLSLNQIKEPDPQQSSGAHQPRTRSHQGFYHTPMLTSSSPRHPWTLSIFRGLEELS